MPSSRSRESKRRMDLTLRKQSDETAAKKEAEQKREESKKLLILQLERILSSNRQEIDNTNDSIRLIAESWIKQITKEVNEAVKSHDSDDRAVRINSLMDESSSRDLYILNQKLKRLLEQDSFINELIRKINHDISEHSESEQKIIFILLINSFLESKAVENIVKMITMIHQMRECIEFLEIYSNDTHSSCIKELMSRISKMFHKHFVPDRSPSCLCLLFEFLSSGNEQNRMMKLYQEDCQLVLNDFRANFTNSSKTHLDSIESMLEGLCELKNQITEIKTKFDEMTKTKVYDFIFSCLDKINCDSLFRATTKLQLKILEKEGDFETLKQNFIKFVQFKKEEIDRIIFRGNEFVNYKSKIIGLKRSLETMIDSIKYHQLL